MATMKLAMQKMPNHRGKILGFLMKKITFKQYNHSEAPYWKLSACHPFLRVFEKKKVM